MSRPALADSDLGAAWVQHARRFFDRSDYDLSTAVPGTFAIASTGAMIDVLSRDYANTIAMIFGEAPTFEEILRSVDQIDQSLNNRNSSS